VLVGQYSSIEPARETLKVVMKELSSYQPEIIKFGYALECGRFLELEDANQLSARMVSQTLFPYLQTYPTSDGRRLHRILVGCFFSRQGALPLKSELELKGYSCRIAQR
jgi:cell division septation protein DedD